MASLAQALTLIPPITGKVINSAVSVCAYIDLYSVPGVSTTGDHGFGGYVQLRLTGDGYIGCSAATTATLTQTGPSAGMYLPMGEKYEFEPYLRYLYITAATGTIQAYLCKASSEDANQFNQFARGQRG